MAQVGSKDNPLRVAIIGSGPAGFYTVSSLFKRRELHISIDMFERLPTPFGLVRAGVAPDHQKDKSVVRAYAKSAEHPAFRFFGNVEYGEHLTLEGLKNHFHQVVFATGASVDRDLGIPGEDLQGSHSATEFVAWYNGHPDFADREFDLTQENVAIIGVGNVAIDVARILCKSHEQLIETDMADYAIEALKHSKVKNVYLLGRRGPAQAAFTPPEIQEMGELPDADVMVHKNEASLDAASLEYMRANPHKNTDKNVACIGEYAARTRTGKRRLLTFRFLLSPTEVMGKDGRVAALKLVRNEAYMAEDGSIRSRGTGVEEELPVGLVFRSVGYRGVALPDVPFNDERGVIENNRGRIHSEAGEQVTGLYTSGWIKRGPSGVIGTNKTCAKETVAMMIEDFAAGIHFNPRRSDAAAIDSLVRKSRSDVVTYEDWQKIDEAELRRGEAENRPRVKFTNIKDMLAVLDRKP